MRLSVMSHAGVVQQITIADGDPSVPTIPRPLVEAMELREDGATWVTVKRRTGFGKARVEMVRRILVPIVARRGFLVIENA